MFAHYGHLLRRTMAKEENVGQVFTCAVIMADPGPKQRSPWSVHFIRKDAKSTVCQICKIVVQAPAGNTSNWVRDIGHTDICHT